VEVDQIFTPTRASLTVHGDILTKKTIGPNNRTELSPEVYASIGTGSTIDQIKVALEAPRNIKILRDNLYDELDPDEVDSSEG
jgi:hypothetical protein